MPKTVMPICILDDDVSVLNSLRELLASDGLEAQTFDDPSWFLAYVRGHPVKLAVLDVCLPQTNGIEIQKRLCELSPATRVIVITGREAGSTRMDALNGGACAFLLKPFEQETFFSAVYAALGDSP